MSIFLVNHRAPDNDRPDRAFAFQAGIEVRSPEPFVPRPDLRATLAGDWDEQVSDLHYADAPEFATGLNPPTPCAWTSRYRPIANSLFESV